MATAPSFSIVIPTYNERDDIGATLQAAMNQTLPAEIIVVDGGSDDDTLSRVGAFSDAVALIEEGRRRGVAAARNAGVRSATGDIVVFLNADVTLPPDFLAHLAVLYDDGCAAVSVESSVENMDAVTARYIQAMHELKYDPRSVGWSEGFSCRRDLALAAAFPEEIPGAGGEDVEFLR
ncbi:MAG TPA: glycosyltransferase family A protein, partial [Dehalococcoidia bacterium]